MDNRPDRIRLPALPWCAVALAATVLTACGPALTRNPVPPDLVADVRPLGLDGLREWGDVIEAGEIQTLTETRLAELRTRYAADLAAGRRPVLNYLSISGGGQWGAFSAGILKAWSESGTRPEFAVVTGISTGAIIAPMAFLGSGFDAVLEEVYTTLSTRDVVEAAVFSGITSGTALTDTTGLRRQIEKHYTPEVLALIAAEHRRGRRLLVGTTNLDASRPMIWDLGAIAASGAPGALELFHDVILASSAIPVAFPPVLLPVLAPDGTVHDEMHVDGGATSQVTLASPQLSRAIAGTRTLADRFDRRLFILMNNDVLPAYAPVRPRITGVGGTAVSSLIRSSGIGDLYKLYLVAETFGAEYRVAWIPQGLPCPQPSETFDPVFMRCLFEAGGTLFREGRLWHTAPPFFEATVPGRTAPRRPGS